MNSKSEEYFEKVKERTSIKEIEEEK